jgi:hypothetical protein
MNIRATVLLLPLLVTAVFLPETAAKEDFLDIKALRLEPVGPVYSTPAWGKKLPPPHPLTWTTDGLLLMTKGEWVGLRCKWSINIVNPANYWELKKPFNNKIPGSFQYDGAGFSAFTIEIPYGTALGTDTHPTGLSSPCFPDVWNTCTSSVTNYLPHSKDGDYTMIHGAGFGFGAKQSGKHTLRCVLDKPKSFSDRDPNNNVSELAIFVRPF